MNQIRLLALSTMILFSSAIVVAKKKVTLKDIFVNRAFIAKTISGLRSTHDGRHYTSLQNGKKIIMYSYETGMQSEVLFDVDRINKINKVDDYELNNQLNKLLIYTNKENIYRHSFKADCYVWDIKFQTLSLISDKKIRMASISPRGNKIAFVQENNLFIYDVISSKTRQITFDGEINKIINGIPDWVYEEEFGYNKAFEWMAEGKYLAFKKFNEEKIKQFNITFFSKDEKGNDLQLYPVNYTFKYPKAGEDNSMVSVHIYNVKKNKVIFSDFGEQTDIYIPRIIPTKNPHQLMILRLNRMQNRMDYLIADVKTKKVSKIYIQEEDQYIDEANFDHITLIDKKNSFIYLSEENGYNHLFLYDGKGEKVKQITHGNWDVTDFYGYNPGKKIAYFQAAKIIPTQREIYSVNILSKKLQLLSGETGFNKAAFSATQDYFINFHSDTNTPNFISLLNAQGKNIRVLEKNQLLIDKLDTCNFFEKNFITVPAADMETKLNAWIMYPLDYDETKKYPLLITQYSGPNSQDVLDRWEFGWEQFLAQEGYVVACVDPRGTGARGEIFRKSTYLQLGKIETEDLIAAARFFSKKNFIEPDKIGIWGWSYGGFTALSCLFKGDSTFKAAIAVAPVTNWRFYDNIYTERFMQKPQDNPLGYDENSPINWVSDFTYGNLLLVHGSGDDNVHMQNTLELAEKLVEAEKQFDMHIYTDKKHSISGNKTRLHLFTKFFNFLEKNLKQ